MLTDSLSMADGAPFSVACTELLETGQSELFLDLYAVKHVPSTVVTEVLKLCDSARARGLRMRVACKEMASRILHSLLSGSIELV